MCKSADMEISASVGFQFMSPVQRAKRFWGTQQLDLLKPTIVFARVMDQTQFRGISINHYMYDYPIRAIETPE